MSKYDICGKLTVKAERDQLNEVVQFVGDILSKANCPMKTQLTIEVVIEEIYINIASYAYSDMNADDNTAEIECGVADHTIYLSFSDKGRPYNPLEKKDPDVNVPIDERTIGGLGIYMVKNMVDEIGYDYQDKTNVLYIRKKF